MAVIKSWRTFTAIWLTLLSSYSYGIVLEEERSDAMYHSYDGGGVTIDGPAVLVRKNFKEKVSVQAKFYQDLISSASIDVLASGSKYSEERSEYGVAVEYLVDSATVSASFSNSSEDDYIADTYSFDVAQEFFGDMTLMSLGYSYGDNIIRRNGALEENEAAFEEYSTQQRFRLGLTQILTQNWIVALNAETVVDDGYLNNPYREVRFIQGDGGVGRQPEVYPEARNSDALALRSIYYLPHRAALRIEARKFHDSWGIKAQNYEFRYIHPLREQLVLELKFRSYTQSDADFYQDLFPYIDAQEFLARDKELSDFSSNALGIGISYQFDKTLPFADKQSISIFWDFIQYDYDNFRNQLLSSSENDEPAEYRVGEEPTYAFDANVLRLFFSVFY